MAGGEKKKVSTPVDLWAASLGQDGLNDVLVENLLEVLSDEGKPLVRAQVGHSFVRIERYVKGEGLDLGGGV